MKAYEQLSSFSKHFMLKFKLSWYCIIYKKVYQSIELKILQYIVSNGPIKTFCSSIIGNWENHNTNIKLIDKEGVLNDLYFELIRSEEKTKMSENILNSWKSEDILKDLYFEFMRQDENTNISSTNLDSNDWPFSCKFCDEKLTSKQTLTIHIGSIHKGIRNKPKSEKKKDHVCDCGKFFSRNEFLIRHRNTCSLLSGENPKKPFVCSFLQCKVDLCQS